VIEHSVCEPSEQLISAAAAARKLGVDVATLARWHSRNLGPVPSSGSSGAGLAYRRSDIEAWQDRVGA
jgi:predicted DNA-binding transcriptional regulator AlpA